MTMSVCLSVCPPAYLQNYMSDLLCMLPMSVARSYSGGVCDTLCTSGYIDDVMFVYTFIDQD